MARPRKYKTDEERRAAQLEQKRRSAIKGRREARGLDPLLPHAGEVGTGAKLTAEQVAELRRLRQVEGYTLETLARKFNIAPSTVSLILAGKTWSAD